MNALITQKDILKLLGLSKTLMPRLLKLPGFPQPIKIGRRNYWKSADIAAWFHALA